MAQTTSKSSSSLTMAFMGVAIVRLQPAPAFARDGEAFDKSVEVKVAVECIMPG